MSMVIVYLLLLIPLSLSADIVANDGYGDNINGFDHNFPSVYLYGERGKKMMYRLKKNKNCSQSICNIFLRNNAFRNLNCSKGK